MLAIMACPGFAHAQMYKCVDDKGVTHYTDGPRPGCNGQEVSIRPQPPISGSLQRREENLAAEEKGFERRHRQRLAEEDRRVRGQMSSRCRELRSEYGNLDYLRRRYATTDDAFKRRIAQVDHELKACK
jgi:hypothetical protein